MYIITLYLIIMGLVIWAIGRELTVILFRTRNAKLEELLNKSIAQTEQAIEKIKQRDKMIAEHQRFIGEMSHMASKVEEWPSLIMMQGNGEKDSRY